MKVWKVGRETVHPSVFLEGVKKKGIKERKRGRVRDRWVKGKQRIEKEQTSATHVRTHAAHTQAGRVYFFRGKKSHTQK